MTELRDLHGSPIQVDSRPQNHLGESGLADVSGVATHDYDLHLNGPAAAGQGRADTASAVVQAVPRRLHRAP